MADIDQGSLNKIAAHYPQAALYTDGNALLKHPDLDAVVVATPTHAHENLVKNALDSGLHVLCEKPLTDSAKTSWELVACAEKNSQVLMVGHVFLFNSGINYLCDAGQSEEVGPVLYLNAVRTNLGPFRSDVNAAWDLASHDIYIFNELLESRPLSVSAVGQSFLQKGVEDVVFLTMSYPNGVIGHIHASWLDPKKVRKITLVGEKKMITWDELAESGPIAVHDRSVHKEPVYESFGEFQLLAREGDLIMPRIPGSEPLATQAREFVRRCTTEQGQVTDGRGSARQAAEVVDILEAADRSLAQNNQSIKINYGG
jgi:predicted dehydrogenase